MPMKSFHVSINSTIICDVDYYTECDYGEKCVSYPSLYYRCEHKRGRECKNPVVVEMVENDMDKHVGPMIRAAENQWEEVKKIKLSRLKRTKDE